jgi:hypothetical protein
LVFYLRRIRPVEIINVSSLEMGEYEDLKKAALDPYVAVRDAYLPLRLLHTVYSRKFIGGVYSWYKEGHYEDPIHYSGRAHSYIMFLEVVRIQKHG